MLLYWFTFDCWHWFPDISPMTPYLSFSATRHNLSHQFFILVWNPCQPLERQLSIEEKTMCPSSGLWEQDRQTRLLRFFNTRTVTQLYHYMLIWVSKIIAHWLIFSFYAEEKKKKHYVKKKRARLSQLSGFLSVLHKMRELKQNFLFHFTQRLPHTVLLWLL